MTETWKKSHLGEVLGTHFDGAWGEPSANGGVDVPILRSTEMRGGTLAFDTAEVRSLPAKTVEKKRLIPGDILVNKSSGSAHLVGLSVLFPTPPDNRSYLCSNFVHCLRPNQTVVEPEFLSLTLLSPQFREQVFRAQNTTSGLRNLNITEYLAAKIGYPSRVEQRRVIDRIKECLSRVAEMQRLREEAATEATALPASALHEQWKAEEIAGAPQVGLTNLGEITTGNTPSRKVPDYFAETGTPWITPGDMDEAKEITTGREFLSPRGIAEARARVLAANSITVCCIGATIGKVAIVRQPTGINQQINAVTFGNRVLPDYGYWACRALYPEILSNAAQATLPILNKSRFGELTIPVPNKDVQKRNSTKLDKVLDASLKLKEIAGGLAVDEQNLRDSILREAFAGNL
jgi:type I restriction enzyme S subunit